jgi:2-keto-4-pentenoate hydratase/2-oxohepta-3-ene-1,7-dioic acid hydratase in catechol pathway
VEEDQVIPLGGDILDFLTEGRSEDGDPIPLTSVRMLASVPRPGKIVGVGLNYRDHAAEAGQPLPDEPVLFGMSSNSVIGPGEAIEIPPAASEVDFEAELGVVIGRAAHRVSVGEALGHVAGYVCVNDVTARDLQFQGGQWFRGKSVDTFLPVGPWMSTADEIRDPQALRIRCMVNDEVMQDSTTSEMVFGVAELISYVTQTITLHPGDIIATGTPAGVGFTRQPPRFLRPGDQVTVEIEDIGALTNPVRGA